MPAGDGRSPVRAPPPDPEQDGRTFARHSVAVASWTAVSRVSGFVRIAVVAAVLGPTYLGNIFLATSSLPMLTYAALTGSLFSNLLVPSLVRHVDAGDRARTARVAGAFLTTALAFFALAAAAILLAGPLVVRLLSVGVTDPDAAAAQRRIGLVLLVMFIPQLLLYAVVGTAEAVMNAHGRFALASGAPVVENLGIIATMVATAAVYGGGGDLAAPSTAQLLLLGLGTTSAVALHAAVQWWGAWRVGVRLRPRRAWREPEIASIVRRGAPSLGYSTLDVMMPIGAIVVANRVPGGVVAFQFALLCFTLPLALGARPVAVSLLPRLSRLHHAGDSQRFRDELVSGATLVAVLAVPAAVALVTLAQPIAAAVTFGQMATGEGRHLIALSLASLGPGVLGYATLMLCTYASYARGKAHAPFRAVALGTGVAVTGMTVAFLVPIEHSQSAGVPTGGGAVLLTLGLTISVAQLVAGGWLATRVRRGLPKRGASLGRPLLRTAAAAALMAVPAYAIARQLPGLLPAPWRPQLTMLVTAAAAVTVFFLLLRWWRAPVLGLLEHGLRGLRDRDSDTAAREPTP